MEFFNSAIDVLQTLVIALGAGLGIRRAFLLWGNVFRQHEQRVRDFLHVRGQRPCGNGTELCCNGK